MARNSMEDLKDIICRELDEIAEKGEMSAGELDTVYKLIVAKEKLLRIEELEADLGYSNAGDWNASGSYGGNSYGNNYGRGNSYGRHYVRGHYSRGRDRYSMDDGKEMFVEQLREMMNDESLSGSDRTVLRKAMEQLQR